MLGTSLNVACFSPSRWDRSLADIPTTYRATLVQHILAWGTLSIILVMLCTIAPAVGLAQDLPSWAEPSPPPPIEKPMPQGEPPRKGPRKQPQKSAPSVRLTFRAPQGNQCGGCPPGKVCCRKGGGTKCLPEQACKPEEEVPLSPTAALLISLFGAGYGAYRLRRGTHEAAR